MDIKNKLTTLQNKIRFYEKKYNRQPHSVSLLAVTKFQPIAKIEEAIEAGQRAFGENYLQEGLSKITALHSFSLEWHFIGSIQSNKTKKIAEYFNWVHSIDKLHIAKRLNDQRPDTLPPLNICLEVNISAEKNKTGVIPDNIFPLAAQCLDFPRLKLRGLMAIPRPQETLDAQKKEFHKLTVLFNKLREHGILLDTLSMGMSHDYEAAIAEGATLVRIGTALFGARIT